jgi:hypothetical protein
MFKFQSLADLGSSTGLRSVVGWFVLSIVGPLYLTASVDPRTGSKSKLLSIRKRSILVTIIVSMRNA